MHQPASDKFKLKHKCERCGWFIWHGLNRFNYSLYSHPGYFGKVGMRYFHKTMNKYHKPTVNLDKLWSLVSEQTRMYYKDKTDGPAPVIDVVRAVSIIRRQYFIETHPLTIVDYQFFLPLLLVKENLVYI